MGTRDGKASQDAADRQIYFLSGVTAANCAFRRILKEGRFVVGRTPSNDIEIADESVSVEHAEILGDAEGKMRVRDLGSTNGTFLNGERITEAAITAPCQLRFGEVECQFFRQAEEGIAARSEADVPSSPVAEEAKLQFILTLIQQTARHMAILRRRLRVWHRKVVRPAAAQARTHWHAIIKSSRAHGERSVALARERLPVILGWLREKRWTPAFRLAGVLGTYALVFSVGRMFPLNHGARLAGAPHEYRAAQPARASIAATLNAEEIGSVVTDHRPVMAKVALPVPGPEPEQEKAPMVLSVVSHAAEVCNSQCALYPIDTDGRDFPTTSLAIAGSLASAETSTAEQITEAVSEFSLAASFQDFILGHIGSGYEDVSTNPSSPLATVASLSPAPTANSGDANSEPASIPRTSKDAQPTAIADEANGLEIRRALPVPPKPRAPLTVLMLGDSMSLCGFGKRLDDKLRTNEHIAKVCTYMASGSNPLSWLKEKPFTNVKTFSGFWSIEGAVGEKPAVLEDVYGMRRGYCPKSHPIPKLEDLLAKVHPDVLIVQNGTNLFGLFHDGGTVRPDRHGKMLQHYIAPFLAKAMDDASTVKRIYWVGSPVSGRVSPEVQDFVYEQVKACAGDVVSVIDSRQLIAYPYKHMEPDHEHFIGSDMDRWADKVFDIIDRDLTSEPIAAMPPLHKKLQAENARTEEPATEAQLLVDARLVYKSQPLTIQELMPYQESLVGYVYDVQQVVKGEYTDKQILVMHPAHIQLKSQPLGGYRVGRTYKLSLRELDGTLWNTVKTRDDSGKIDLIPYIRVEDEVKFPGQSQKAVANAR